jgi:hypothetical protein
MFKKSLRQRDEEMWRRGEVQRQRDEAMRQQDDMLRPSLSSKLSFRLVDLTISFAIEHLVIFSKLIHYIATCIANDVAVRNSGATVPTSPTTTSLQATS